MDKKQELTKTLEKFVDSRDKVVRKVEEGEARIEALQATVNDEVLKTGSSNSIQELLNTKEMVKSFRQALENTEEQISLTRKELVRYEQERIGGELQKLDQQMVQAVLELQKKMGAAGLNGEVDRIRDIHEQIARIRQVSGVTVLDLDEHTRRVMVLCDNVSEALLVFCKSIDSFNWGPAMIGEPSGDRIGGFGRTKRSVF